MNFSFSNINMSIGEGYERNNKKEKGNRYLDYSIGTAFPVNNIPCYQLAEHELKGPKTRVSNSC